jgi:hypothetical protein
MGYGVRRFPWHGWDFDPHTGQSKDAHAEQEWWCINAKCACVGIEGRIKHARAVSDVMGETMTNWGVDTVLGIVGHSNLGIADALRLQEEVGKLRFFGVRHEGAAAFVWSGPASLTGKPAAAWA